VKLMMFSMLKITARPSESKAYKEPLISPISNCPNRACEGMPKISMVIYRLA